MIRIKNMSGAEIVTQGRDGRIHSVDSYALGMSGFVNVSAMEGILLTDEMRRDFRMLDRKGLSPQARRRWLIAKYGKSSS
jgi:hypothetical protein